MLRSRSRKLLLMPANTAQELAWRLTEAGAADQLADAYKDIGVQLYADTDQIDYIGTSSAPDPLQTVPRPRAELYPAGFYTYPELHQERIAVIGAGAGAMVTAAYLIHRGATPDNVVFLDPRGKFGGGWNDAWVRSGGINNPRSLRFLGRAELDVADRSGHSMQHYLARIADTALTGTRMLASSAVSLQRQASEGQPWHVKTNHGTTLEADSVIISTGTPRPRRIKGARLFSNLDTITNRVLPQELIIERRQRVLEESDFTSRRPIVLIGLGNSTAAMLTQIQQYEDKTGQTVDYRILTDLSRGAVLNPELPVNGHKPIFRNPAEAYLTGYSGDLARDRSAYFRALGENKIISDVTEIQYDRSLRQLMATTEHRTVLSHTANTHVFALLGYERDDALFASMGALLFKGILGGGVRGPTIRPCDGAVLTAHDGYMSNIYATGAAAASSANPNVATVPGIQGQVPGTTVTIAVRNHLRHPRQAGRLPS
jgi:hypothetical protein